MWYMPDDYEKEGRVYETTNGGSHFVVRSEPARKREQNTPDIDLETEELEAI